MATTSTCRHFPAPDTDHLFQVVIVLAPGRERIEIPCCGRDFAAACVLSYNRAAHFGRNRAEMRELPADLVAQLWTVQPTAAKGGAA